MLEEHIGYLSDGRRTALFREAFRTAIRPGDVVADLGCGSGILGLLCLQAGAGRVYAIDSGAITHVARESFQRAGYAERATVIRGVSQRTVLPEKVDVVVCDHIGFFGFDYGVASLLNDARRRFLKPDGRIVPSGLALKIAPVEAPEAWEKANQWRSEPMLAEFNWVGEAALNRKYSAELKADALLSPAATAMTFDFRETAPEFLKLQGTFTATRDSVLHGIAGFFDCHLHGGVQMTNSPGVEGAINRPQAFLPLSQPSAIRDGEEIIVTVTARPENDLIAWDVRLPEQGIKLRQSTLQGLLLGAEDKCRSNPLHRPKLTQDAAARALVLALCDGTRSIEAIVEEILAQRPGMMPDAEEARRFILRIIETDTL